MARHSARKISEHSAVLQRSSEFVRDIGAEALPRKRKNRLVEAPDSTQPGLCVCKH